MLRDITDTRNSMRGKGVRIHINIANDQRVKSKLTVTFLSRSSLLSVSGYIYLFRSHVSFPTNIVNWLNWNKKQYPEINLEEWFYSFSDFLTTCSETRALIILTLSCFVDCAVKIFSVDQVLDYLARYDCKKNSTGIVISGTSRQSLSLSQAQGYLLTPVITLVKFIQVREDLETGFEYLYLVDQPTSSTIPLFLAPTRSSRIANVR